MTTTRSLTVMVVAANEPKEIDAMSFATRRARASKRIPLNFPSNPDVVARRALDFGSGVYESPRVWDETTHEVVETSLIAADTLGEMLERLDQLGDLDAVSQRLVREAGTDEDLARVARALAEEIVEPAAGPAEEAAAFRRVFHALATTALEVEQGIAWEERALAPCECAISTIASEDTSLGSEIVDGEANVPSPLPRATAAAMWLSSSSITMSRSPSPSRSSVTMRPRLGPRSIGLS